MASTATYMHAPKQVVKPAQAVQNRQQAATAWQQQQQQQLNKQQMGTPQTMYGGAQPSTTNLTTRSAGQGSNQVGGNFNATPNALMNQPVANAWQQQFNTQAQSVMNPMGTPSTQGPPQPSPWNPTLGGPMQMNMPTANYGATNPWGPSMPTVGASLPSSPNTATIGSPRRTPPPPLGDWSTPTFPQPNQGASQTPYDSVIGGFLGSDKNLFNPEAYKDNDAMTPNYISSVLPLVQLIQNAYSYDRDSDEAARRYDLDLNRGLTQDSFQRWLSTNDQAFARWQAETASGQWDRSFGHTQYMDMQGLGLQEKQIGNEFTVGMDRNRADRDVASTYANSNMYQANQQLAGQKYMSDQERIASMYGADQGLRQAGLYSDAQRYAAQLGLQEAQGYASAQRYGADQTFAGQRYTSDAEERMNQLMMQNNLQTAAMQTYGRSQAPNAQWARGWG